MSDQDWDVHAEGARHPDAEPPPRVYSPFESRIARIILAENSERLHRMDPDTVAALRAAAAAHPGRLG